MNTNSIMNTGVCGSNAGIALTFASAKRGYRVILTLPVSFSVERDIFTSLLRFWR